MRNQLLAVLLLCAASPAMAKDVDIDCAGCQAAFDAVAEDLVAAIDYKAVGPAEATGITGFGIGLVSTYVPVDEEWETVTGSDFSAIGLVGLQVTKGLPFDIDLGAFYTTAPGTNVDVFGGELRYAFLPGSTVMPAVALRVAHVVASGIDDFDLDSTSVDLSVSKGFTIFTPYAGVGYVNGAADPSAAVTAGTGVDKSEVKETKLFVGFRLGFGLFEITPQFTQVGDVTSYSARLGFSFGL
jgi:opacity protein-like surface antigen